MRFRGELRFRFGLHGARLLRALPAERALVRKQLVDLYDARSAIVQGGRLDAVKVQASATDARRLTAEAVRTCLEKGWPTARDFADLVLG